jgi:hypothetical protein
MYSHINQRELLLQLGVPLFTIPGKTGKSVLNAEREKERRAYCFVNLNALGNRISRNICIFTDKSHNITLITQAY